VHDIVSTASDMSAGEKDLLVQVIKLVHLLLAMPATNAISEKLFSVMCCIKTYLRSTMSHRMVKFCNDFTHL